MIEELKGLGAFDKQEQSLVTEAAILSLAIPSSLLHLHHAADLLRDQFDSTSTVTWVVRGFSIDRPIGVLHLAHSAYSRSPEAIAGLRNLRYVDLRNDPFIRVLMTHVAERVATSPELYPMFATRRINICPDAIWRNSPFVQQHIRAADIGYSIVSVTRISAEHDAYLIVLINRPWNSEAFENQHADTLGELTRAMTPAAIAGLPNLASTGDFEHRTDEIRMARLSKAQRRLLPLLLSALSEKEIARHVHRSPHTVHSHAREIYRTLGVNGRRELMSRFVASGAALTALDD